MGTQVFGDSVYVNVASAVIASVVATIPGRDASAININTIDVTGDNASQTLDVYVETGRTRASMAMAAGQSVCYVGVTSGFEADDNVIVQHKSGKYQKTTVLSVGTTSITLGANLTNAFAYDTDRPDEIIELEKKAQLIIGAGTLQKYGDKQLWIPRGSPAYFAVSNGTTAAINAIAGVYT